MLRKPHLASYKYSELLQSSKEENSKVTIFGVSHANNCVQYLQRIFSDKAYISGYSYPGAPLTHVYRKVQETVKFQNYKKII